MNGLSSPGQTLSADSSPFPKKPLTESASPISSGSGRASKEEVVISIPEECYAFLVSKIRASLHQYPERVKELKDRLQTLQKSVQEAEKQKADLLSKIEKVSALLRGLDLERQSLECFLKAKASESDSHASPQPSNKRPRTAAPECAHTTNAPLAEAGPLERHPAE